MNTYIKNAITTILFGLCMPTMAADTFIVKYKLNETQKAFLSSQGVTDTKRVNAKTRELLMEKLSKERLDALSAAAETQVTDLRSLATGAHVIKLSQDLNEIQTEQFINSVKQYNDIDFIEENKIQQAL